MRNVLAALTGIALGAAIIAASVGVPRLYATGCIGPVPVLVAIEESNLPPCETVARLPWATE